MKNRLKNERGEEEECEEHITNHKNKTSSKSRRTQGEFGASFPLEFLILTLNTWISGPLSHISN
jgi:hypothetical protein